MSLCLRTEDGNPSAAILVSPDRLGVAWLHLYAASDSPGPRAAWNMLWEEAKSILTRMKVPAVWVMTAQTWLMDLLLESGFSGRGRVIAYARPAHRILPESAAVSAVGTMAASDLPEVEQLDHAAFSTPWQMDCDSLSSAFGGSLQAAVHRTGDRITGYLMAGASPQGLHITRIAVHPDFQRKGIARALLLRALEYGRLRGAIRITVNTQHDNSRSRRLYRSLGFSEMGESYPVFRRDISSGVS
ncbi:MAG: GNAT family N-acetyltransferase [Anaerolineales bacterium]|nr:GNAT family N-acetyltransferase [Anaerolineales bacterium]